MGYLGVISGLVLAVSTAAVSVTDTGKADVVPAAVRSVASYRVLAEVEMQDIRGLGSGGLNLGGTYVVGPSGSDMLSGCYGEALGAAFSRNPFGPLF